jgi:2-hydroxy-3-oxopropionate reductase
MANIGFIGLGIMGKPMALHLKKGGHKLFLHARRGVDDKELLENGGTECASAADVAEAAEFIVTMLPNTATCQELFNACMANGLSKLDHSAMVRALEMLANFSINSPPQKNET